jgi:hypothetical protein
MADHNTRQRTSTKKVISIHEKKRRYVREVLKQEINELKDKVVKKEKS